MEIASAAVFVLLLLASVPIAFCIAATGLFGIIVFTDIPVSLVSDNLFHALDAYTLIAVPLFFVAGNIMSAGTIAEKLVNFARSVTGFLNGGLGISAVLACGIFASVTGSSTTALVAIGTIMFSAMTRAGYSGRFSIGLLTTSGSLGILLPPSVPMIVYAFIANQSVGRMFLAGVLPGLLILALLAAYSFYFADEGDQPREQFSLARVVQTVREGFWALLLPVVVLGGIYGGIFTATEAAGVSVVYALIVEMFIYRELKWRDLPRILDESALFSAAIMVIIAMATFFGQFLTLEQIPESIVSAITAHIDSKWVLLIFINVFLLFVGTFMDIISAMLILAPILIALANRYQIDLVHLGIIFVINMEIGFMTPPLGLNLYAAQAITKMTIGEIVRAVVPTVGILLIGLLIVTYFPQISLWLPGLVYD